MALGARPAWTAPQVRLTPARGSSRRPSTAGSWVMSWPSAKTTSPVRCGPGGVAALGGHRDGHRVRGGGDGPDARADLADVDLGVAVQRVDLLDAVEDALVDRRLGAAGLDLLGGLEDAAHPDRQLAGVVERLERQRGAVQGGGVDVVAAGVRDAVALGGEGQPGRLRHGQGVEVGAQADAAPAPLARVGADVDDEAGALEQPRVEPGRRAGAGRGRWWCRAPSAPARDGRGCAGGPRGARARASRPPR